MRTVILASSSPRRREILEQVGIKFEVIPSQKEEVITKSKPEEIVIDLASMKANDVLDMINDSCIIIGADTIVAHNDKVMGKPKDAEEAKEMIQELQGKHHEVYTGVSVIINEYDEQNELQTREICFYEKTKVYVSTMSEEEIQSYIETKEPFDKAGAYAIQGRFATFIRKIEGDYFNVVGLPIAKIYEVLSKEGISIQDSI